MKSLGCEYIQVIQKRWMSLSQIKFSAYIIINGIESLKHPIQSSHNFSVTDDIATWEYGF